MKSDLYTKAILTVIALCLVLLVVDKIDLMPKAYAGYDYSKAEYGLVPLNEDGTVSVRVEAISPNEVMDVNIKDIDTYDLMKVSIKDIETSDELSVNIDEIGGSSVSSGGPIKVKMD
ncbi:MAG: hypothetical protein AAGN35_18320 [Bacteroidota bacterium]